MPNHTPANKVEICLAWLPSRRASIIAVHSARSAFAMNAAVHCSLICPILSLPSTIYGRARRDAVANLPSGCWREDRHSRNRVAHIKLLAAGVGLKPFSIQPFWSVFFPNSVPSVSTIDRFSSGSSNLLTRRQIRNHTSNHWHGQENREAMIIIFVLVSSVSRYCPSGESLSK